jgi:hypothetical protein
VWVDPALRCNECPDLRKEIERLTAELAALRREGQQQPEHGLPWAIADDVCDQEYVYVCSVPRAATVALCEDYDDAAYIVQQCNVAALAAAPDADRSG